MAPREGQPTPEELFKETMEAAGGEEGPAEQEWGRYLKTLKERFEEAEKEGNKDLAFKLSSLITHGEGLIKKEKDFADELRKLAQDVEFMQELSEEEREMLSRWGKEEAAKKTIH